MSRPHRRSLFLSLGLLLAIFSLSDCGGGGSPPASIPAPVSALMTVSTPDASGTVTVSGAPRSVLPGASVLGTNATATGLVFQWRQLLLRSARAQQQPQPPQPQFTDETVADSQGAFVLRLTADPRDILFIQQAINGELSEVTQEQVP